MALASINIVPQMLNIPSRKILSCLLSKSISYRSNSFFVHPASQTSLQNNRISHLRIDNISNSTTCTLAHSSVEAHPKSDDSISAVPANSWAEFAQNVSGEWDGYGADFSVEGKPIELPESVVPEAYREWEVKVYDWQTQCPTLAEAEDPVLTYKLIKLLPTVGCEADAATRYSIDERSIGGMNNEVSAFAYQRTGCYVAVWPMKDQRMHTTFEVEHCMINPEDRESRVRVIQVMHVDNSKMSLQSIRVFCEQWYGPFRNGDQLGGCAIRDSAFASTDATKLSDVVGLWQGPHAVAKFSSSQAHSFQELTDESIKKSMRDEANLVLLPKQLWCSVKEIESGNTCCEVGWLFDQGHATTSRCIFSGIANLKEISLSSETTVLEM